MKKTKALTTKLLEELERTPLIETACDKIGISRNTYYRWAKEDKEFLKATNKALSLGKGRVNDIAISNILSGIKAKDMKVTMYWLSHNHPDFRRPFRDRVDVDDFIQYTRLLDEKAQVLSAEMEAKERAGNLREEKIQEAMRKIEKNQAKWFLPKQSELEKAQELFDEWKKDYLDNGKEPPKIT